MVKKKKSKGLGTGEIKRKTTHTFALFPGCGWVLRARDRPLGKQTTNTPGRESPPAHRPPIPPPSSPPRTLGSGSQHGMVNGLGGGGGGATTRGGGGATTRGGATGARGATSTGAGTGRRAVRAGLGGGGTQRGPSKEATQETTKKHHKKAQTTQINTKRLLKNASCMKIDPESLWERHFFFCRRGVEMNKTFVFEK